MTIRSSSLSGGDLLLTGGSVFAEGDAETSVEAMLVVNGKVEALGSSERLRALAAPSVVELDLHGRVVLPGLIDAHTHVEFSTMGRNEWVDVRGLSPERVCAVVAAEVAATTDPDHWVIAQGTFLQPLPDRAALDAVSPGVPVIVRESMHRLQANTEALRRAGFLDQAPSTPPGVVVHVDDQRRPTGHIEEGFHLFPIPALEQDRLEALIQRELRDSFASHGVTTVFEIPATHGGVAAYTSLAERGALPTRITLTPVVAPGLSPLIEQIGQWRHEQFGGASKSDLLDAGGIKIFIDGDNQQSFDTETFNVQPRNWGAVTRTLGQLREELIWATEHRVQVWVHAIGDLAQEYMLEAVAQARERVGPPALPTRLEHAGNLKLTAELLARIQSLDVIPVPTANFMSTDDGTGLYAYRTLAEGGLRPPGNSDTGGAIAEAPNPWFGIAHMMRRSNRQGVPVAPEESVSVSEGVRGYTQYAALAGGLEGVIGSLAPGLAADFAVYTDDPRARDPEEMQKVSADMTFVGGRKTWQANA
ncbi:MULTISPECIES: amidohydrolase [unclassified Leucobacter]|uniref:amidohydrolase n=1 Tax=unclassified Leucobacter TaxID=2621730 RepID=UPI00165D9380|nr:MULTISPECIES: amidohydrolase family protein [unclassified Leucobacter]MBC9937601.1 amidohydrolase family protein [Leucobacter sp. cx-87]